MSTEPSAIGNSGGSRLAPIALFVYNRLDHAQQTVTALLANDLASESDLIVFSDSAKTEQGMQAVSQVREFVHSIQGFKSIRIVERPTNWGLARSIISGVTEVCAHYGRVIVLEDDLVTSPRFLKYMNDGLDLYTEEERVISIHGYMYPLENQSESTFFLRGADCWGWATWQRGWNLFEPDGSKLLSLIRKSGLKNEFNFLGGEDYIRMLESQIAGRNDSWAVRWYASAFLKDRLTLYPGRTLVLNIGNDGSGTHCGTSDYFSGEVSLRPIELKKITLQEDRAMRVAIGDYLRRGKRPLLRRILAKISSLGH